MDSEQVKSVLKMSNLHFSECSVKNNGKEGKAKLFIDYDVAQTFDTENSNKIRIQIKTTINSEDRELVVFLCAVADFELIGDNVEADIKDYLLRVNTVAIMFPFVRSQVALLTTQPGMTVINLQPIDINKLLANK